MNITIIVILFRFQITKRYLSCKSSYEQFFRKYTKANTTEMVRDIRDERYAGKSVIVCWSHKTILELAESFGVAKEDLPRKWKGKRYNLSY
jgi:hypothetical protein